MLLDCENSSSDSPIQVSDKRSFKPNFISSVRLKVAVSQISNSLSTFFRKLKENLRKKTRNKNDMTEYTFERFSIT